MVSCWGLGVGTALPLINSETILHIPQDCGPPELISNGNYMVRTRAVGSGFCCLILQVISVRGEGFNGAVCGQELPAPKFWDGKGDSELQGLIEASHSQDRTGQYQLQIHIYK